MNSTLEPRSASPVVREHMNELKSAEARRIESEFGVPTSGSMWPRVFWLACVVVPEQSYDKHVLPTDDEVRQIRSYIEFKATSFYNDTWAKKILEDALPVCGGHNTVIFGKYPETPAEGSSWTGWGYRRMTWETGTWPHAYQSRGAKNLPDHPLTLVETIDHCEGFGDEPSPKWEAWKAAHPEIFPA